MTHPISTRNLALPDIDTLKHRLQCLAVLDAIMSPDWEYRYYSFDSQWAKQEEMGSMRNGSGDDFYVHFSEAGCILFGFDHESEMSPHRNSPPSVWPGVLDRVPSVFDSAKREPAFSVDDTSFCIWREPNDASWNCGPIDFPNSEDPDGSGDLLSAIDGHPQTYFSFASEYFELDPCFYSIGQIYKRIPLTHELVVGINPAVNLSDVKNDVIEIGYPIAH